MEVTFSHRCLFCGQAKHIPESLAPYAELPCCSKCGLSASESNMRFQEGLAALFEKSMTLNLTSTFVDDQTPCSGPVSPQPKPYSITQHYHHSAHITRPKDTTSSTELFPAVVDTLRRHGVDASTLSKGQWELYERALPEQRSRLIQIWQISLEHQGPSSSNEVEGVTLRDQKSIGPAVDLTERCNVWSDTSTAVDMDMYDSDQGTGHNTHHYAEPYMITGYEAMAHSDKELAGRWDINPVSEPTTGSPYKLANDPAYRAQGQRRWECARSASSECQYGMFEEMDRYSHCGVVQSRH
ncbi:uncharacterized protein BO97DRAFT_408227 [Aspergillus homomorphus CBS 101889]|uniref:Uncharacterized protein n=1 Tax=Aspergillus homomorphus (strain CBS 101889) TaxID=1450537 RepID=A0A395HLQ9_ASPHC|nr:hypothetical protein BO97DRAFT_408227 [Aspergillus homomorphus CBS 101889]RAL08700.1 hypothetical protein BO97DRAFT_408227 [Aspergillus homomorphus CBS 101889]